MEPEVDTQVEGGAESSDVGSSAALSDLSETQDSQAASSDTSATTAQEPSVAELQKQHKEREARWNEGYRAKEAEIRRLQERLAPHERAAQVRQEDIDRINDAFVERAGKIGYPAAFAEMTEAQQQQVEARTQRDFLVDQARQKFVDAGLMPQDFDRFYNARYWADKDSFMSDVDLHLNKEHVTKVTGESKAELARQAEEDQRRKAANKQPKGGSGPSPSGKATDPGQAVLDGMANAARRVNAASSEL